LFSRSLISSLSTVGYNNFDFDSTISVDVLRSLYLAPKVDVGNAPAASIEKQYGAKSEYNSESKTVAYSSETKYPPVKLLTNTERKRILGGFWVGQQCEGG
jgi:UDP-glucuronate decarboxylase